MIWDSCLISMTLGSASIPQGNWLQLKIGVKFRQHSSEQVENMLINSLIEVGGSL